MKKALIVLTTALLAVTCAMATSKTVFDQIMEKIMESKVEELLTEELFAEDIPKILKENAFEDPVESPFHNLYYYARKAVFERHILQQWEGMFNGNYRTLRGALLAVLKFSLDEPQEIRDFYDKRRDTIVSTISDWVGDDWKRQLEVIQELNIARSIFYAVKDPVNKERFAAYAEAYQERPHSDKDSLYESTSQEEYFSNQPPEFKIEDESYYEKLGRLRKDFHNGLPGTVKHKELAEFAGRRVIQGGDELVEAYAECLIDLIDRLQNDSRE